MTPSPIVQELETTFQPLFDEARQRLASEYPEFSFETWSSSVGGATSYQGHDIGIECVFPDARPDEANCVAAQVGVWHITTNPELNSYCVTW
jgi:hypothetical protein